jgi:hypothetical protein
MPPQCSDLQARAGVLSFGEEAQAAPPRGFRTRDLCSSALCSDAPFADL